ncbi:hypothetical protein GGI04_000527 [Coemansia thaxteri]|uniref:Mediator of RNA polymerase II transcription subunit 8 n=1 Tax=Coemansia thaxteri TaxID=2663907 RepID=A0A9W8EFE0_9FUNG|nr:hypothetical protein H4R26_003053 [Coemansia thaxteri]KAJ2009360.1 hypothetical protein GGI04_000527 [Coemansia thaxteri]KAJ2487318.1 hypothetical protein EV174_000594 [Coemansia sp. RSA 2320]
MDGSNIAELEMLRRQLQQLHESFAVVIDETRPTPDNPALVSWPDLLSKFNVLAAKYAMLNQAVNKKHASLLKEMAVAPKTRPSGIHEQNILLVLLRTKLAPEIEHEEERIWEDIDVEMLHDKKLDWAARADMHESLAISAMNSFLHLQKKHTETVDTLLEDMLKVVPPTQETAPEARPLSERPVALEDVLAFMSAGVRA